jgi:RNA polymerase sigma factor (sigma-70 family)
VEDIVQECYCRLARLTDVSTITRPRAYLFTIAMHLAQRQRERARVVRIEAMSDMDEDDLTSDRLTPERIAAGRQELRRVQTAIATLTERARRIFVMRKVEGMSQKEIAKALGISETIVENEAARSLRRVIKLMTEQEGDQASSPELDHGRARRR